MARIVGVDIPNDKRVLIGLTYIFGIGRYSSQCILEKAGVDINIRVKDLTPNQINEIKKVIDNDFTIEGELRRKVNFDIKRLMDIGCYRGLRHRKGLPCRGQNTKNNARTRKGKKKIVTKRK